MAFDDALNKTSGTGNDALILHRCLSLFLTNYLLSNYWSNCKGLTDPGNHILKSICSLWELTNPEDCEKISIKWLPELLRCAGNYIALRHANDPNTIMITSTYEVNSSADICLISILLSIMNPKEDLLIWIIEKMRPSLKFEDIKNPLYSNSEASKIDYGILESLTYLICICLSNDIVYCHLLMYLRKNIEFPQDILEKSRVLANSYIQYALSRGVVLAFALRSFPDKGLEFTTIQGIFPESMRDLNKVEKVLENITNLYMDLKDYIMKFKLPNESLSLFDPFLLMMNNNMMYSLAYKGNIEDPSKADFFFGEFANHPKIMCKTKQGLSFIPFKEMLRQLFTNSGIINSSIKLIKSKSTSSIMLSCSFKLILSCINYEKNSKVVSEAWKILGENIEKFVANNSYINYCGEIFKGYLKLISSNTIETIDSHLDEILTLAKEKAIAKKLKIAEMKKKKMMEFASRNSTFGKKNNEELSKLKKNDKDNLITCSYCRESIGSYNSEAFGKLMYIQKSMVYGYYLNQLLKDALGNNYDEEHKFKNVTGRSQGAIFTTCGHFIHSKCLLEIQKNFPKDNSHNINHKSYEGVYPCPLCKNYANVLVPPADEVIKDKNATKYFDRHVISRIRKIMEPKSDKHKECDNFMIVCKYLMYQLNLISLNDVEDFVAKKDIIISLVHILKRSIQGKGFCNTMENIQNKIQRRIGFLTAKNYGVFKANLSEIFTMFLVSSKLLETPKSKENLYEELRDKIIIVVKLAIVQILLRVVYKEAGPTANMEMLSKIFGDEKLLYSSDNLAATEGLLVAFLKRIFCLKTILWPAPGSDNEDKMLTASWLVSKSSLDFYAKELGLGDKPQLLDILNFPINIKPAYFPLAPVNSDWLKKSLGSLINSFSKRKNSIKIIIPKEIVVFDILPLKLVQLPMTFSELKEQYQGKKCSSCNNVRNNCAICLLCGELLCVLNPSNQIQNEGELTVHSKTCISGCGIFLSIFRNKVLLIDGGHACNYPSPYVTKFGESVDFTKNPGNFYLRLESRILNNIKTIYLKHSIPQIVRANSLYTDTKYKPFSL